MSDADLTPGWQWAAQQARRPDSGILQVELAPGVPMFFSHVPATPPEGFRMGSRGKMKDQEPRHRVCITRPFLLSTFPVTQAQWQALMGTTVLEMKARGDIRFGKAVEADDDVAGLGPLHPMYFITWNEALDFARNFKKRFPGCVGGLPTEAQWECACRAGTTTEYHTGDGVEALWRAGWFRENSNGSTQPVGLLERNAFGFYDMHGNVYEWCIDACRHDGYQERGTAPFDPCVDGKENWAREDWPHISRGGSWSTALAWMCESGYRFDCFDGWRRNTFGFRFCLPSFPLEFGHLRATGTTTGAKLVE
ncbi:MAG: formylglycine-generating enzyme family protein [Prosthecobacter sp.]